VWEEGFVWWEVWIEVGEMCDEVFVG
jgi:hypothetical protein